MAAPALLLQTAANVTGATLDLGAGALSDKINYEIDVPNTVTAATITLAGSTDNFVASNVPVVAFQGVTDASGFVRLTSPFRYLRFTVASYAGSGSITASAQLGKTLQQA